VTPVPTAQCALGLMAGRQGSDNGVEIVRVNTKFKIPTTTCVFSRWKANRPANTAQVRRKTGPVDAAL